MNCVIYQIKVHRPPHIMMHIQPIKKVLPTPREVLFLYHFQFMLLNLYRAKRIHHFKIIRQKNIYNHTSCPPVIVSDYYAVNFIKLNLLISLYNPSSDDR